MEKEFEVLNIEPYFEYKPDRGLIKVYKIKVRILGKFEDWITVTDEEFMKQAYIDKIKELVEAYKRALESS